MTGLLRKTRPALGTAAVAAGTWGHGSNRGFSSVEKQSGAGPWRPVGREMGFPRICSFLPRRPHQKGCFHKPGVCSSWQIFLLFQKWPNNGLEKRKWMCEGKGSVSIARARHSAKFNGIICANNRGISVIAQNRRHSSRGRAGTWCRVFIIAYLL